MKAFYTEYRHGRINITELEVEEKNKTFLVVNHKELVGWYLGQRRFNKNDEGIFMSLNEALFYIEKCATAVLKRTREELAEAEKEYNVIFDIANAIRRDPDCAVKAVADLTAK